MGMDYVVENRNFNIQLGETYNGLGDFKKKTCFLPANQLLKEKK
jgi:hypothetical protein